jgi:membrane protease YdiL (CAAX protease family)
MVLSFLFNAIYGLFLGIFDLRIQEDLTPLFQEMSSPWFFFLGGAIIAPVVEEIFFRGFVFGGLRPRYGWVMAAVISSIAFAVLHFTPTAIIPIFILGFIFAFLYQLSGSIWPGILMHVLTNSLALGATYIVANADRLGIPMPEIIFRWLFQ